MSVKDWDKFIKRKVDHVGLIGIKLIYFADGTSIMIRKGKYIV